MGENKDLLAYCGFYCGDCLGYTGVIADAAESFSQVLAKYQFDVSDAAPVVREPAGSRLRLCEAWGRDRVCLPVVARESRLGGGWELAEATGASDERPGLPRCG